MRRNLRDYALIGDCETAALIHRNGSIDWLCWPRFDSGACFAALLGGPEHGSWRVSPVGEAKEITRRYRDDTLVLETRFATEEGECKLVECMPVRSSTSDLIRVVVGVSGRVRMVSDLALRFDYGRLIPWIRVLSDGSVEAISGPHAVVLHSSVETRVERSRIRSEFEVREGEWLPFVLTYRESHCPSPSPVDVEKAMNATENFWRKWASCYTHNGPWRDAIVRSLITVKALTYRPTGGIVAAPTTSLPEKLGGERNWDYRFCWIRDATLTLQALSKGGCVDEAAAWRDCLLRAAAGMPEELQPIYGIAGEHRIEEEEIPWLHGFCGSSPVRVGNRAHRQFQLCVYGEVMDAMHQSRERGLPPEEASWQLQLAFIKHLETIWKEPDRGIWEVRQGNEQFTYSKIMAWVALDRAIRAVQKFGYDAPLQRWRELRRHVHKTICERGFNSEIGSFVRTFGGSDLDASLLLTPMLGFLSPKDSRVSGTVRAIEKGLIQNGFVLRYDTNQVRDGLETGEGAFLACSFWYADNLVMQGRRKEAQQMFERVLRASNDVGLLSEEIDPDTGEFLGNFPQTLSHIALIDTACNLADTYGSVRD